MIKKSNFTKTLLYKISGFFKKACVLQCHVSKKEREIKCLKIMKNVQHDIFKCLVLYNTNSQRYLVFKDIKQRKAANSHFGE